MTELEARDVPAWWAVSLPEPADGTLGVTDAIQHAGDLIAHPGELSDDAEGVLVEADTEAQAVGLALSGTITVILDVNGAEEEADYHFGPATVVRDGYDDLARPFRVTVTGTEAVVALEDLVGYPDLAQDHDYDDRTWTLTVTESVAPDTLIDSGTFVWSEFHGFDQIEEKVTIHFRVATEEDGHSYRWQYRLVNDSLSSAELWGDLEYPGVQYFQIKPEGFDLSAADDFTATNDWEVGADPYADPVMWSPANGYPGPDFLPKGKDATFTFRTLPRPIGEGWGAVGADAEASGLQGQLRGPGAMPRADIDIDGFDEATEDNPGGLVVRRAEGNNAPRKKVIIQQVVDGIGQVAPLGAARLSYGDKVKLYNAENGGDQVASGTTFSNLNLPMTLWAEGVSASGWMRDARITAEPKLGATVYPGGADTVAFTVLWVDVTVALDGEVSADNDKRLNYRAITLASDAKLGLQRYNVANNRRMGWGSEARGLVAPVTFDYPGSDLRLDRDGEWRDYENVTILNSKDFTATIPWGNDSSSPVNIDNNPRDSNGYIYDLDSAGLSTLSRPQNTIHRTRTNFKAYAGVTIDGKAIRASNVYDYFIRFSMKQGGAGNSNDWTVIDPPDIATDKSAGTGRTKLTIDLS